MFHELYVIPALAVAMMAVLAAPLGSLILWQRQSFLSDTLAHASLLGVALAASFQLPQVMGMTAVAMGVGVLLIFTRRSARYLSRDAVLALIAQGALALGLLAINWRRPAGMSPMGFLFGDLLSVDGADLAGLAGGALVILGVRLFLWQPLLAITASESLARLDGIPVVRIRILFSLCLAVVVALLLKLVGALLLSALLLIPAATARLFARAPGQMVQYAILFGFVFGQLGLVLAFYLDQPVAPMIVITGLFGLVMAQVFRHNKVF
ncbi:MAG: metal ABC transporter permease [Holosporales bacterium]